MPSEEQGLMTMPLVMPRGPWRVSLYTTACQRLSMLEQVVRHAMSGGSPLAMHLGRLARERGVDDVTTARLVLQFSQSLGYVPEPPGEEWFQPVPFTLEHGGDCEDLSTALVTIARAAGLDAELAWIDQPGQKLNHVTVMLRVGDPNIDDGWVWADPSVDGARLGENPYHAAKRLGQLARVGTAQFGVAA